MTIEDIKKLTPAQQLELIASLQSATAKLQAELTEAKSDFHITDKGSVTVALSGYQPIGHFAPKWVALMDFLQTPSEHPLRQFLTANADKLGKYEKKSAGSQNAVSAGGVDPRGNPVPAKA